LIQQTRGLLLVGILTLVITLVVMFPARTAFSWASAPFISMSGIQGTVWSGSAREFSTNGVYLLDLKWRARPLQLLTGKLVYEVTGSPVSGFFQSEVAIRPGGRVTLRNLTASVPLQMFERASGISGLRGNASLQFERLELVNGGPSAMDGTLEASDIVVPPLARASLGGYRAEFFTQNNGVVGSVEDTDGVYDLAGSLQISNDRSYEFLGKVMAKPGTSAELKRKLDALLPADEAGRKELRFDGVY
jgi:general secretion pathway protein N